MSATPYEISPDLSSDFGRALRDVALQHRLNDPTFVHTNLDPDECSCKIPGGDGPSCPHCGSITVRFSTCYRCMNCGETTGCG